MLRAGDSSAVGDVIVGTANGSAVSDVEGTTESSASGDARAADSSAVGDTESWGEGSAIGDAESWRGLQPTRLARSFPKAISKIGRLIYFYF